MFRIHFHLIFEKILTINVNFRRMLMEYGSIHVCTFGKNS